LMETLKFKTEKGLKLIGFVPVSAMRRWHSDCLYPYYSFLMLQPCVK
jgi:hypothetical protein